MIFQCNEPDWVLPTQSLAKFGTVSHPAGSKCPAPLVGGAAPASSITLATIVSLTGGLCGGAPIYGDGLIGSGRIGACAAGCGRGGGCGNGGEEICL